MSATKLPEVWLRGPLDGVPALLQPVGHALLQAREELNELMIGFPDDLLWEKVAGMASPGFHLQHLTGVLDRLSTYAQGGLLNDVQLDYLALEGKPDGKEIATIQLVSAFNIKVDEVLQRLKATEDATLTDWRGVGRAQLPSNVIGLYTHSAEHTMRHFGQLIVTVKVLLAHNR